MVTKCWDEWAPDEGGGAQGTMYEHIRWTLNAVFSDRNERALRRGENRDGSRYERRLFTSQSAACARTATTRVAMIWPGQTSRGDA